MMSEDMKQRGENLWNALALTAAAWRETNAMLDELSALMHNQLPPALRLKELTTPRKKGDLYDTDPSGSVNIVRLVQWGLVPRRKQSAVGWLYANAAIGSRDGAELLIGKTPSLTVGYGFGEDAWDEILRADDPTIWGEDYDVVAGGRLILKRDHPWQYPEQDSEWHFCLPLFVLNTVVDLKAHVVTPAISLLKGEAPDVVLGRHPHAFQFRVVDERLELA